MFTVFRGVSLNVNKLLNLGLLRIEQRSSSTSLDGLAERGLIVFAAGRSPMRRIDHQLVLYGRASVDSSLLLMLVAVDIQAVSLLLSPSLSFPLHSPFFHLLFLSSCYQLLSLTHRFKKQRGLLGHCRPIFLTHFTTFCLYWCCEQMFCLFFSSLSSSVRSCPWRWTCVVCMALCLCVCQDECV